MTMIRHTRVSSIPDDDTQPDLIQPSDWNADHDIPDPDGLREAIDAVSSTELSTGLAAKISTSARGAANGVASLDAGGHVPSGQVPSPAIADVTGLAAALAALQPLDSDLTAIAALTTTTFGRALLVLADAAAGRTALALGSAAVLDSDTDVTLAANSDLRVATQKAIKAYIASVITGGASDVMIFKGVIDCSANPDYPAADAGNLYKVSVAGKIGGSSGPNVEAGDTIYCLTDSTASGTHADVGANWDIVQVNIDGAVSGPSSATDLHIAVFDGTTGKIIKDSGSALGSLVTGVSSVFGRTGAVVKASGDYALADITGLAAALALLAPLADPTLTGHVTVPTPTSAGDATRKDYVDGLIAGLSWKQAMRAATTVAGTLASSFANGSTIDGVSLVTGDRILVKNQVTASENGIYVVAVSGAPTRATDADAGAELVNASCYVSEGTVNADTQWTCTTNATITPGSTSLAFAQLATGGSSPARATVTKTTASLASGSTESGTVTLSKGGRLYYIAADRACRVVLYATSAARTADSGRAIGVPATAGTGILCEFVFSAAGTLYCGPETGYYDGAVSPTGAIPYAITNSSGGTSTVQVQFTHLALES